MSTTHPSSSPRAWHGARVLVTGLRSFTGHYLEEALTSVGAEVFGTITAAEAQAPSGSSKARTFIADLTDATALAAAVQASAPTHVVHLAAISFVAHDDVEAIYRTNVVGTRKLLAALHAHAATSLRGVILASSANIYGNASVDPIGIDTPPQPANDYAVSKLAMEHMARLWHGRLPLTLVRPFNYTGVGQSDKFLVPKIVAAFRARASTLELGNLDVERDFSDVRDVANAYVRLLETADALPPAATPRIVNLCSGQATSLRDIVNQCESITGHRLEVRVNPAFVRADEVRRLRGDRAPLERTLQTGPSAQPWQPKPFSETLAWMLQSP